MDVSLSSKPLMESSNDAVVIFFFKDHLKTNEAIKRFPAQTKTLLQAVIGECDFQAEPDQVIPVHTKGAPRAILLVGLGERNKFNSERLRFSMVAALKHAHLLNAKSVAISLPDEGERSQLVQTIAETAILGTYRYDKYKTERKPWKVTSVLIADIADKEAKELKRSVDLGVLFGELGAKTRELVNTPPDVCTPDYFANFAVKMGKEHGFTVTVYDEKQLKAMNMQGILHVGAGGANPPRLVVATYKNGKGKSIAYVGKGVCFDSGGLDIKPAAAMDTMKLDKAGACAMLHVLAGCANLKLKGTFTAYMPLVENMPGNAAYKPGDIIVTRSKKTIEVLNTDAEGRVILSDALFFAAESKPDYIIDAATLTGACIVALGPSIAGLMGNNAALLGKLKAASQKTGERVWELPMDDDFMEMIKSDFADLKNVVSNAGGPGGGTITAAKFLSAFVNDLPWAHLDIAGPAWMGQEKGYLSTGATGFGVRLLLQFAIDEQ